MAKGGTNTARKIEEDKVPDSGEVLSASQEKRATVSKIRDDVNFAATLKLPREDVDAAKQALQRVESHLEQLGPGEISEEDERKLLILLQEADDNYTNEQEVADLTSSIQSLLSEKGRPSDRKDETKAPDKVRVSVDRTVDRLFEAIKDDEEFKKLLQLLRKLKEEGLREMGDEYYRPFVEASDPRVLVKELTKNHDKKTIRSTKRAVNSLIKNIGLRKVDEVTDVKEDEHETVEDSVSDKEFLEAQRIIFAEIEAFTDADEFERYVWSNLHKEGLLRKSGQHESWAVKPIEGSASSEALCKKVMEKKEELSNGPITLRGVDLSPGSSTAENSNANGESEDSGKTEADETQSKTPDAPAEKSDKKSAYRRMILNEQTGKVVPEKSFKASRAPDWLTAKMEEEENTTPDNAPTSGEGESHADYLARKMEEEDANLQPNINTAIESVAEGDPNKKTRLLNLWHVAHEHLTLGDPALDAQVKRLVTEAETLSESGNLQEAIDHLNQVLTITTGFVAEEIPSASAEDSEPVTLRAGAVPSSGSVSTQAIPSSGSVPTQATPSSGTVSTQASPGVPPSSGSVPTAGATTLRSGAVPSSGSVPTQPTPSSGSAPTLRSGAPVSSSAAPTVPRPGAAPVSSSSAPTLRTGASTGPTLTGQYEQHRQRLAIKNFLKQRGYEGTEPPVAAIRTLLHDKIKTEQDLKDLEAFLKTAVFEEPIEKEARESKLETLQAEEDEIVFKLSNIDSQVKRIEAQLDAGEKSTMREIERQFAKGKIDLDKRNQMLDDLAQRRSDREKQLGPELAELWKKKRPLVNRLRAVKEMISQKGQKNKSETKYQRTPEKLLGMINMYFAKKESGNDTPDYVQILEQTQEQISAERDKQLEKRGKLEAMTLGIFKPRLTPTLQAAAKEDPALKKLTEDQIKKLVEGWDDEGSVDKWIQGLEGPEKEKMEKVVPALIGHIAYAVSSNRLKTLSLRRGQGLLKHLRKLVHNYSMSQAETASGNSIDKMNAYFSTLNTVNKNAARVQHDKWYMRKVFGKNVGIPLGVGAATTGVGALGYFAVTKSAAAASAAGAAALAALGPLGLAGVAVAGIAGTLGYTSTGIKNPETRKKVQRAAVRTLAAGGIGLAALGAGMAPLLAVPAVVGGLILPELWENKGKMALALGAGALAVGKFGGKWGWKGTKAAAPWAAFGVAGLAQKFRQYVGIVGGLGLGFLPFFNPRYNRAFGLA